MNKHQVLAEVAALEATLPAPGPSSHLPYAAGPEDVGSLIGRRSGFLIGPHYSQSLKVRRMLADLDALDALVG